MANYSKEELQYIASLVKPYLLELVKASALDVDNVEVAGDYEGITSLPAYDNRGGVRKILRVPLSVLAKPAQDAADELEDSIERAKEATTNANGAASNADNAAVTANSATNATVAAISKANTAADNANAAADRANAVVAGDGSVMYVTLAEYKSMWQSGAIQEKCIYVVDKHSTRALYAGVTKIYPPASGTLLSDGVFRYDNVLDMDANVLIK